MLCICFLALFLGYQVQAGVIQDEPAKRNFGERAAKSVETLCLKNADQNTYEEALAELNHIRSHCWHLHFLRESQSDEDMSRLCIEHRESMIQCILNFNKKLEPCLESEENDLGQFLLNAYGNYSTYLCNHIVELVPEKLESTARSCISEFVLNPSIDPSQVCYENSEVFGSFSSDTVFTKVKLCSDLKKARACYGDNFKKYCPEVKQLRELILNLLGHALVPCEHSLERQSSENTLGTTE